MKKTKWYPGNVKPVHVGVYETEPLYNSKRFQFWNGQWWGYPAHTIQRAFDWRYVRSTNQSDAWRGLTEPV
jgi:hypothetical protein